MKVNNKNAKIGAKEKNNSLKELLPGISGIDLGLLLIEKGKIVDVEKQKTGILVIGDLHIGYEEALNKTGVFLPRQQLKDIIERLDKIFLVLSKAKVMISKIIINGDLKHEFSEISEQEWRDTIKVIDYLSEKLKKSDIDPNISSEVVLLKGNHDTILGPIAGKRNITIAEHFYSDGIYICHGNNVPKSEDKEFKSAKTIIIGHVHPSVLLSSGARKEKYKAFVVADWNKKKLIVLPSFCELTYGFDLINETNKWPFLADARNARIYIAADAIYDFGLLEELKEKHCI
jgi:uncharacterized protein